MLTAWLSQAATNDTFAQAIDMLKPGGRIGNVNYLGSGDFVKTPRVEWGCGMGHKTIAGGLMPGWTFENGKTGFSDGNRQTRSR